VKSGPSRRAERSVPGSKLTAVQVLDIRARHAAGATYRELAHMYDVGSDTIGLIVLRKTWQHLPAAGA
jgi:hypothetical protein